MFSSIFFSFTRSTLMACVSALGLAVAGSVYAQPIPNDKPPQGHVVTDSVLRIGNEVSLATVHGAQVGNSAVACDSEQAWLLYTTFDGRRLYPGNLIGKFGERAELPRESSLYLKSLPAVSQACGTTPDWRNVTMVDGLATLIDLNSIEMAADGSMTLWGAFDYPEMALDPPYQAPYGEKFERFRVSCGRQTYALLSGYDVDNRNRVTDGLVFPQAIVERVGEANRNYKALFAAACGDPAELKRLPAFAKREKSLSKAMKVPAPTAAVLAAIDALKMPSVPRKLKRLVLEGIHTYEGKGEPFREVRVLVESATPGLFSFSETGAGYESKELSFLGFVTLARETHFIALKQNGSQSTTSLEFEGNWQMMPLGEVVRYSVVSRSVYDSMGSIAPVKNTTECKVISASRAEDLHPTLQGVAKQLECRGLHDQYNQVLRAYFLQDYNYLVGIESSKSPFMYYSRRITEVVQQ